MSHRQLVALALCVGTLVGVSCTDAPRPTAPAGGAGSVNSADQISRALAPSTASLAFGPETVTVSTILAARLWTVSGYGPTAVLHVVNGTANGGSRVNAGFVTVDGRNAVDLSKIDKNTASLDVPITLSSSSIVGVVISGARGATIAISITADPATQTSIGRLGGTVQLLGSKVTLKVPLNALSSTKTLTASLTSPPGPGAIPGSSVDLGPEGTTFASPVTVSIGYDPTQLPAGVKPPYLYVAWWNTDHWERLPGNAVDATHRTVSATTTHFSTYAILPNAREFCPGDVTAESNFQTAIDDAPVGGTLWICNGAFTVAGALSKALTVSAENPGQATLVQDPAATGVAAILTVSGIPSGMLSVTGLTLSYSNLGLYVLDYDSLSVTGTTFAGPAPVVGNPFPTAAWLALTPNLTAPASAVFDHDTFVNGYGGLLQESQPVHIVTTNSNFAGQGSFGLIYMTATGASNPAPAGGAAIMRGGRAEHNTFTNCGVVSGACIGLEESGADTVRFNSINASSGHTVDGIFVNRSGVTSALTVPAVITDNVIMGHAPLGDPSIRTNWAFDAAIKDVNGVVGGGPVDDIERNQISGAFLGFFVSQGVFAFLGDNTLTSAYVAMVPESGGTSITAHRNDLSGYTYAIGISFTPPFSASALPAHSLTCNWWGSASGPTGNASGLPNAASYVPFATTPIANTATACTP